MTFLPSSQYSAEHQDIFKNLGEYSTAELPKNHIFDVVIDYIIYNIIKVPFRLTLLRLNIRKCLTILCFVSKSINMR